jgi:hypothetical protein
VNPPEERREPRGHAKLPTEAEQIKHWRDRTRRLVDENYKLKAALDQVEQERDELEAGLHEASELARAAIRQREAAESSLAEPVQPDPTPPDRHTQSSSSKLGHEGSGSKVTCSCEVTGECRVAMSGPTCFNPDCPPCQTPELDTDPNCPVHGHPIEGGGE